MVLFTVEGRQRQAHLSSLLDKKQCAHFCAYMHTGLATARKLLITDSGLQNADAPICKLKPAVVIGRPPEDDDVDVTIVIIFSLFLYIFTW